MRLILLIFISYSSFVMGKDIQCIAYHGDQRFHQENTLKAFEGAIEVGAQGVEFPIRHTKDGIPIILNDPKLTLLGKSRKPFKCPLDKNIAELKYSELVSKCVLKNGEEIPQLDTLLDSLSHKKIKLYIEFKDHSSEVSLKIIRKNYENRPELIKILSFNSHILNQILKLRTTSNHRIFWKKINLLKLSFELPNPEMLNAFNGIYLQKVGVDFKSLRQLSSHKEIGVWASSKKDLVSAKNHQINYIITDNILECLSLNTEPTVHMRFKKIN